MEHHTGLRDEYNKPGDTGASRQDGAASGDARGAEIAAKKRAAQEAARDPPSPSLSDRDEHDSDEEPVTGPPRLKRSELADNAAMDEYDEQSSEESAGESSDEDEP